MAQNLNDLLKKQRVLETINECRETGGLILSLATSNLDKEELEVLLEYCHKEFSSLQSLNLSANNLEELPENVGLFSGLTSISVSNNKLKKLPDSFSELKKLKNLYLNKNKFSEFPRLLENLPELENIYLNDNALQTLPESILDLPKIKSIRVSNNPINYATFMWIEYLNHCENDLIEIPDDYPYPQPPMQYHLLLLLEFSIDEFNELYQKLQVLPSEKDFQIGGVPMCAREVVENFLAKEPVFDLDLITPTNKAAVKLIRDVLNFNPENGLTDNQKTILAQIASSLGDCATPIRQFLVENYLRSSVFEKISKGETLKESEELEIERIALDYLLIKEATKLGIKKDREFIELINGLTNSIYLKNANKNKYNELRFNILKERCLLPKTTNVDFAFNKANQYPDLKNALLNLVCLQNKDSFNICFGGQEEQCYHYQLDLHKLEWIKELFLLSQRIVRSNKFKIVESFQKKIDEFVINKRQKHQSDLDFSFSDDPNADINLFNEKIQKKRLCECLKAIERFSGETDTEYHKKIEESAKEFLNQLEVSFRDKFKKVNPEVNNPEEKNPKIENSFETTQRKSQPSHRPEINANAHDNAIEALDLALFSVISSPVKRNKENISYTIKALDISYKSENQLDRVLNRFCNR